MKWINQLSEIMSKAVKYTALLVVVVKTIEYFNTQLQAINKPDEPVKTPEND